MVGITQGVAGFYCCSTLMSLGSWTIEDRRSLRSKCSGSIKNSDSGPRHVGSDLSACVLQPLDMPLLSTASLSLPHRPVVHITCGKCAHPVDSANRPGTAGGISCVPCHPILAMTPGSKSMYQPGPVLSRDT